MNGSPNPLDNGAGCTIPKSVLEKEMAVGDFTSHGKKQPAVCIFRESIPNESNDS